MSKLKQNARNHLFIGKLLSDQKQTLQTKIFSDGVHHVRWMEIRAINKHRNTIQLRFGGKCRIFVRRFEGMYRINRWPRTGIE